MLMNVQATFFNCFLKFKKAINMKNLKNLFYNEDFLLIFIVVVITFATLSSCVCSTYTDYKVKILAIEHQCEKIYDASGYYYGNCKK